MCTSHQSWQIQELTFTGIQRVFKKEFLILGENKTAKISALQDQLIVSYFNFLLIKNLLYAEIYFIAGFNKLEEEGECGWGLRGWEE